MYCYNLCQCTLPGLCSSMIVQIWMVSLRWIVYFMDILDSIVVGLWWYMRNPCFRIMTTYAWQWRSLHWENCSVYKWQRLTCQLFSGHWACPPKARCYPLWIYSVWMGNQLSQCDFLIAFPRHQDYSAKISTRGAFQKHLWALKSKSS